MREFGSEFPAIMIPDGYFESLSEIGTATYLRSGREALALIARSLKKEARAVILAPAYCCRSMTAPFIDNGWTVVYYRLNADLSVDIGHLQGLLTGVRPQAVLLMNFYGMAPTDSAVETVKRLLPDCICIEDFSHCLFSLPEIFNSDVDFYAASIRKSLGVCDGAVVVSNQELNTESIMPQDDAFADSRHSAQEMKRLYGITHNDSLKQSFRESLGAAEHELDMFSEIHAMSRTAQTMLKTINAKQTAETRRINLGHLVSIVRNIPNIKLLDGMTDITSIKEGEETAYFSLPILTDNRDAWQKELASQGLYCPVLWPIDEAARATCRISAEMSDRMLSVPIDQRYDFEDIEQIGRIISQTANSISG